MAGAAQDQFRIGAVIRQSLAVLRGNAVPLGVLYLAVNAPSSIYALTLAGTPEIDTAPGLNILTLVETLLGVVVTAAVTYSTIRELRGWRVDFAEFAVRGMAQGGAAIKVALLSGILVLLGFVALVIPGLVLSTIWWVAIPVAVVERPGTVASLRRSSELTKGVRWRIFGLFVAYLLVLFGGLSLVGIVLFALIDDIVLADWLWTIVGWVWVAAAMALQAVLVAVSYYHLRVAKEGTGIDEIAAVFD
jgi:hypothetical protein